MVSDTPLTDGLRVRVDAAMAVAPSQVSLSIMLANLNTEATLLILEKLERMEAEHARA